MIQHFFVLYHFIEAMKANFVSFSIKQKHESKLNRNTKEMSSQSKVVIPKVSL